MMIHIHISAQCVPIDIWAAYDRQAITDDERAPRGARGTEKQLRKHRADRIRKGRLARLARHVC